MGMSAHVYFYFGYFSLIYWKCAWTSSVFSAYVCVCVCSFICVCCCHCQRCNTVVAVRSYILLQLLLQPNMPTLQLQLRMSYIFICRCHCHLFANHTCGVVGVVSVCKSCVCKCCACNSVWCCSVSGDGPHTQTHTHIQVDILKSQLATQFAATHCNTLHLIATHCNPHSQTSLATHLIKTHCITLHHAATHCIALQHTFSTVSWLRNQLYKMRIQLTFQNVYLYSWFLRMSTYIAATHCIALQHTMSTYIANFWECLPGDVLPAYIE